MASGSDWAVNAFGGGGGKGNAKDRRAAYKRDGRRAAVKTVRRDGVEYVDLSKVSGVSIFDM